MTPRDKRIGRCAVGVGVAAGLFPPWSSAYRYGGSAGYHLLFIPPGAAHIDTSRLFLEWVLIGGVAVAIRYLWER
jgi:hypothetical protein